MKGPAYIKFWMKLPLKICMLILAGLCVIGAVLISILLWVAKVCSCRKSR